jgi:hypothetical protein
VNWNHYNGGMPARTYTFRDLVTYSGGATENEVTNRVQKHLSEAEQDSTGTGDRRRYKWNGLNESRIAHQLHQIPGGMPIAAQESALWALRFELLTPDSAPSPWRRFLNPATRIEGEQVWLCWSRRNQVPKVLDQAGKDGFVQDHAAEVVILLRLDQLVRELEELTGDHAFSDQAPDTPRPVQDVIEDAIARELTKVGIAAPHIQALFAQLHDKVNELRPELRAMATFVRYVQTMDALVAIVGQGPNYRRWRQDVDRFLGVHSATNRKAKMAPPETGILQLLAAREADQGGADQQRAW